MTQFGNSSSTYPIDRIEFAMGRTLLWLYDDEDWAFGQERSHIDRLAARIDSYVDYIDQELYEQYAEAMGRRPEIRLLSLHACPDQALYWQQDIKASLNARGIGFAYQLDGSEALGRADSSLQMIRPRVAISIRDSSHQFLVDRAEMLRRYRWPFLAAVISCAALLLALTAFAASDAPGVLDDYIGSTAASWASALSFVLPIWTAVFGFNYINLRGNTPERISLANGCITVDGEEFRLSQVRRIEMTIPRPPHIAQPPLRSLTITDISNKRHVYWVSSGSDENPRRLRLGKPLVCPDYMRMYEVLFELRVLRLRAQ